LSVPRERHFHALGKKAFAAALAAPGERRTATFGAHPGAETMLLFSGPLRSL
jgi:hypothetical protein